MKPTNAQLRQFITTTFNDSELETFCFDYFPEVKYTRGMEFNHKVELLIGYCQRRDLETNLLANLQQERPQPFADYFSAKVEALPDVATKPRNPRQIFISHAHEDAELAQRLAHDLEAEGWSIWIAPDSIRPGEKWASAISRGLDESGIFVLLLTPHAVQSRWVRHETDVAVEMEHDGEMRFIPLQVEACRIPALWRAYQRIPFRSGYKNGLVVLMKALPVERRSEWGYDLAAPTFDVSGLGRSETEPESDKVESGTVGRPATAEQNSFIHEKTGLKFVRVPAGEFLYGDKKEKKRLPEFWIGKTPVTNAVYKRFLDANPKQNVPFVNADWAKPYNWDKIKRTYPAGKADHPVVLVSWHDAQAFCEWAGLQLPTEEEWEKAARGSDGREYPWGNEQPTRELCNFGGNEGGTTPVGKYSPQGDSPFSCVDMSGNVWEWTSSDFDKSTKVLKGGSWYLGDNWLPAAARSWDFPDPWYFYGGVRVVVSLFISDL
ncbi:MAG: SUMF1/EgtB/PvdO family nonheme iron enzyme [Ardenticatenaceae bacterium]|nr:SUMF1/EgtB/PvdO family nonheme iron enzyme [Ardenticatenaceae bacterium]MCB9446291.1 SUMF1/EgtB/PvdO family nonheme iron enzyme [Ardenticatenaceae bacterium]